MFACDHEAVVPDVLCVSKGLSGGIYPIGAYITSDRVWRRAYGNKHKATLHTSTFGGNTLACTAALAAINVIVNSDLAARASELGDYFHDRLAEVAARHQIIREVRGRGLMVGLDFTPIGNPVTRGIRTQTAAMVAVQMLHKHRIISLYTFTNANVIRLAPPLTVERDILDRYVAALDDVLTSSTSFPRLAWSTTRAIRRSARRN